MANYFLSDKKDNRDAPFLRRARSGSTQAARPPADLPGPDASAARLAETITEVSEPPSPDGTNESQTGGPSMLTTMFRRSPPDKSYFYAPKEGRGDEGSILGDEIEEEGQTTLSRVSTTGSQSLLAQRATEDASERSPLLAIRSREGQEGGYGTSQENGHGVDLEDQKLLSRKKWLGRTADSLRHTGVKVASILPVIGNPKRWDRRALWQNAVVAPVACLPAVVVGLLLNILDALSYGEHSRGCVFL